MLFTRIHTYYFPMRKDEAKNLLVGKHVNIHKLDFEVLDRDYKLSIIPHAEQVEVIKTLPVTTVLLDEQGGNTRVTVTSRMRQLDSGGPTVIIAFCTFIFIAAVFFWSMFREPVVGIALGAIGLIGITSFAVRMQRGYFDYVRQVQSYVKTKLGNNNAVTLPAHFA